MRIRNKTDRTIMLFMHLEGWDDQEEVLKPGEISSEWLHLEDDDVIEIKFPENKRKSKK